MFGCAILILLRSSVTASKCATLFFYVILSQSGEEVVNFGLIASVARITVLLKPRIHLIGYNAEFFKQTSECVNIVVGKTGAA